MRSLALYTLLAAALPGSCQVSAQDNAQTSEAAVAMEQASSQAAENAASAESKDSSGDQADKESNNPNSTAKGSEPSPFDYNPSEEISEDLSVSFPVDI